MYTSEFYASFASSSQESARQVIPLVLDLIGPLDSVLDVGCGIGTWLAEFAGTGISDIVGVDGHYVDLEQLLIDPERFVKHDLTEPLQLQRRFDLVVSVEVAEHIEEVHARRFVKSLCDHANEAILFSAAVPGQGGVHHVNEQWPSYWQPFFADEGFSVFDIIRPRVWGNPKIESWYRQNLLLYCRGNTAERLSNIGHEALLDVLHPSEVDRLKWARAKHLRWVARSLPDRAVSYARGLRAVASKK